MPRHGRIVLPNTPHHVVHRGHNRGPVFWTRSDFDYYLNNLSELKSSLECRLFAYCLMGNHVHLVVDPGNDPHRLGRLMKSVAARHTRYVNRNKHRSGTLWESRYKSSAVETDRYLLACTRYVELNPVRARMVRRPEDYPWSSYHCKVNQARNPLVDLDPCFLALGATGGERTGRYRVWVQSAIADHENRLIREALQRGQLTGGQEFVAKVRRLTGRQIEFRGRGRPLKGAGEK